MTKQQEVLCILRLEWPRYILLVSCLRSRSGVWRQWLPSVSVVWYRVLSGWKLSVYFWCLHRLPCGNQHVTSGLHLKSMHRFDNFGFIHVRLHIYMYYRIWLCILMVHVLQQKVRPFEYLLHKRLNTSSDVWFRLCEGSLFYADVAPTGTGTLYIPNNVSFHFARLLCYWGYLIF